MKTIFQRILLTFLILGASSVSLQAQVKGTVKNSSGEALAGVSLAVKGAPVSTTSDADGSYLLNAGPNATIIISYSGYLTQSVQVEGRWEIDIVMRNDEGAADKGSVSLGYVTRKRSTLSSSISSVASNDLELNPAFRVDNLLQGLVSGVQVTRPSGAPGAAAQVRVRGISTVNDAEPLYIVDGTAIFTNIDYLDPKDIQRIDVLKDAAAAAIYGTRAANGVIVITTKSGNKGKTSISYGTSLGLSQAWRKPAMLNATEFAVLQNENAINSGRVPAHDHPYSLGDGTDWASSIFGNATVMKHNLSVSGGSDRVTYNVTGSYLKQDGIVGGEYGETGYDRFNLRFNLGANIFDSSAYSDWFNKLDIHTNGAYSNISTSSLNGPKSLAHLLETSPLENSKSISSSTFPASQYANNRFVGGISAGLQIWNGLMLRSSLNTDRKHIPADENIITYNDAKANKIGSIQQTNTLDFNFVSGIHDISIVLGQEYTWFSLDIEEARNPVSTNETLGAWYDREYDPYKLLSFFGTASYCLDGRFILGAGFRSEQSSNYGLSYPWWFFPSASAAWNFGNESIFRGSDILSSGKLHASFGLLGNDSLNCGQYEAINANNMGMTAQGYQSADRRWEETRQFDLGLDLGFLSDEITFSADWYTKKSLGILLPVAESGESLYLYGNSGEMLSSGVDLELAFRHNIGDIKFHVIGNASYNRTSVSSLGNEISSLEGINQYSSAIAAQAGMAFPFFYGWQTDGIFQSMEEVHSYKGADGSLILPDAVPGDVRFVDLNGDGTIDEKDRTILGKAMPDWTFGLNLGLSAMGFDFNVFLQGQCGNQIYNAYKASGFQGYSGRNVNTTKAALSRWTGEGSGNKYPRICDSNSVYNNLRISDIWVEDGSYLRVRNVQLGYTLPQSLTYVDKLRFFIQAENLLTLTRYSGFDPEVGGGNLFGTEAGIDYGVYPQARTISAGIDICF